MIGYRKHSFARAHALLQTLRADLEDLATLRELQKLLLREIVRAEEKIRELKTELKAIKKTADGTKAKRRSYLENRIEGFRQCAYTLSQIALDNGYEATFDRENADYPMRVNVPGGDDMSGVSSHILTRIGLEFVSPEWIVLSSIELLKGGYAAIKAEKSDSPQA
jgi:hypothetical protein